MEKGTIKEGSFKFLYGNETGDFIKFKGKEYF